MNEGLGELRVSKTLFYFMVLARNKTLYSCLPKMQTIPFRIAITSMQKLSQLRLWKEALTREPPARHSRLNHVRSER